MLHEAVQDDTEQYHQVAGRPQDEELTRLRKENKTLREANEILKKAAVIFAQERPR
jgi:transposase-like protein